ncbi:MAG: peptide deformylase [Magnetococcales bacterium]|nr:peptide deformylase [Magnetococcales bacterium]
MALLPILTAPDARLKQRAQPVVAVDDAIRTLMDDMLATMYHASGVGLAAPQVGVLLRVIVMDVSYDQQQGNHHPIYLANPQISASEGDLSWKEGCLSIPDTTYEVNRRAQITVQGLGRHNEPVTLEATGLLAVCLQHEIDHLDGILFIDHLSRLKRELTLKRLRKRKDDHRE